MNGLSTQLLSKGGERGVRDRETINAQTWVVASELEKKLGLKLISASNDGIVKSRHSRENGNPENSNYLKRLDSCLRRNDRK